MDFEKVYGRESSSSKEQGNGANRNWTCKDVHKFRLPSRGWFFESFIGLFPILQWLPQYSIKKCLHSDLVINYYNQESLEIMTFFRSLDSLLELWSCLKVCYEYELVRIIKLLAITQHI